MTLRFIGLVGMLTSAGMAGACVSNGEQREQQVQRELAALRQDILAINKTLDANRGRAEQQLQEESKGRASLAIQFQEVATEVRLAQGRLEENARGASETNRRIERLTERLDETLSRVASLSTSLGSLEGQIQAQQERVDQLSRGGGLSPGPPTGPSSGQRAGTPSAARPTETQGGRPSAGEAIDVARLTTEGADQLYRAALTEFTRQNFDQAARGFQAFVQTFAQDGRAPDASYWLAESLRGQGNYAEAAKEFDAFVRKNPESPKIATAQVRHGETLLLSGDKAGCTILEKAQAQYPRARAGALAKDLVGQHCRN